MSTKYDDLNKVILSGNLVDKPQEIEVEGRPKFAKASLASNKSWKKGEEWHSSVVFNALVFNNGLVGSISTLEKGDKISIVGETKNRALKDEQGDKKGYAVEIRVLELHILRPKKEAKTEPETEGVTAE
jgi:single-stranded DNA-binding protein